MLHVIQIALKKCISVVAFLWLARGLKTPLAFLGVSTKSAQDFCFMTKILS